MPKRIEPTDPAFVLAPEPAMPGHGRTPDNTPIPGGGRWAWDDQAGAWLDRDAVAVADAAPQDPPAPE